MKYRLLDFLVCPDCGDELLLRVFKEERVEYSSAMVGTPCKNYCSVKKSLEKDDGDEINCNDCCQLEINEGVLECTNDHVFPIVGYIPRMLPDAFCNLKEFINKYTHLLALEKITSKINEGKVGEFVKIQKNTKESFGYEWLRYDVNLGEEDREIFLRDSQIAEETLRGKIILDAGCGMGRYTRVAGKIGAEIIGIDLSQSVLKAYQLTWDNPLAHIVQGDILHLPFRKRQFDIIYSLGVLHHTPDAKKSFFSLTSHLKKGGIISIWVYGAAGKFQDFTTNPLRKDRQIFARSTIARRLHWQIVYVRELVFKTVRFFTTRLYLPLLYLLCYPLAVMGKLPLLKYLTASVHENWKVRLLENFDWFSPQYQSHHTKEEVAGWFNQTGLEEISMLEHGLIPRVGLRGKLGEE